MPDTRRPFPLPSSREVLAGLARLFAALPTAEVAAKRLGEAFGGKGEPAAAPEGDPK